MKNFAFLLAALALAPWSLAAAPAKAGVDKAVKAPKVVHGPPQPWAPWVEPDFPFFSSILDARREGVPRASGSPGACCAPARCGAR